MTDILRTKAERCRTLTLTLLGALIVLLVLWRTLLIPAEHFITIIAIH